MITLGLTDPLYAANVTPYLAALGVDPANVARLRPTTVSSMLAAARCCIAPPPTTSPVV